MTLKPQAVATKPVAPKREIDKNAMKSAKGGLNPQPLPPKDTRI